MCPVWVRGFYMDVEFFLSALGDEECSDDFLILKEDAGVLFFKVFFVRAVPVLFELLRGHE